MELRKVQKTGGSTFIISLPKDWAVANGIEAGDALAIVRQTDGSLAVSPGERRRVETRRRRVEVDGKGLDALTREVIAAYLAGYHVIEVRGKPRLGADVREGLRQLTRKIMGPEIVDESADGVVVQDLLDPTHLPMRKGVQRMYFITRAMHRDAVAALLGGEADLARDVAGRDDDVDRLFWLVTKQMNLVLGDVREGDRLGASPTEALDYLLVARILERIGDHARRIALQAGKIDEATLDALRPALQDASDEALRILEEAYHAFQGDDVARANAAIGEAARMDRMYEALLERGVGLPGPDAVPFAYVLESLARTGSYATDIAELAINHAVASEG